MAIKKDIDYKGIRVIDAYIKIQSINVSKDSEKFNSKVSVGFKANKLGEILEIQSYYLLFDVESKLNIFEQSYQQLKQLDQFADSIDV